MKRYRVIACEIFYREICRAVADAPDVVDVEFLPQGLHDIDSGEMAARLQRSVDDADGGGYDALLFGYGLCNNGILGIQARSIPLVFPRAHDCITLFLGGRDRYREQFDRAPGTYYLTTGWIERDDSEPGDAGQSMVETYGLDQTYDDFVRLYGEENAEFLAEVLGDGLRNYNGLVYIDMGEGDRLGHVSYARGVAEGRGWTFETIPGEWQLLANLLNGTWSPVDYLVVPPGHRVDARYDDGLIVASPAAGEPSTAEEAGASEA